MIPVMNSSLAEKKRGDLLIPDNFAPTKCGIDLRILQTKLAAWLKENYVHTRYFLIADMEER